jgi:hypothetical protein
VIVNHAEYTSNKYKGDVEVRNVKKGLITLVVIVILIPIIFKLWFAIGMISACSAKPINTNSVRTYKADIKKEFSDINYISIYHRFGRINFDFTAYRSISLDQCKKIAMKTKEFIEKEGVVNLLPKGYGEQEVIKVEFNTKGNIYTFESPYWKPTEDTTDNPNNTVKNNYKVWYMRVNNESEEEIVF